MINPLRSTDSAAPGSGPASNIRPAWLRFALWGIAAVPALRFATLAYLPHLDPSEACYALIGKTMAEQGDVFPPKIIRHGELVPFLSKPPLHFWLQAVSTYLLGSSEFSSRLPSFLSVAKSLFSGKGRILSIRICRVFRES